MVVLPRVSDGIAILNALGTGSITVEAEDFKNRYRTTVPIGHLHNKNEQAVWRLFDGEIDVARALALPMKGRQVDPSQHGRWPGCPHDVRNVLDCMLPDSIYRLRQFGALMLLDIRIGTHLFPTRPRERCAIDAGLDEMESTIACRADLNSACRDLLYLR